MNSIGLCKEQIGNGIFLFNTRAFLNKLALMFYNVLGLTKEESIDKYILQDGHVKEIYINHGFCEISAAIRCFRVSPYGSICIMKNYSKLTTKNPQFLFENKKLFLPKTFP